MQHTLNVKTQATTAPNNSLLEIVGGVRLQGNLVHKLNNIHTTIGLSFLTYASAN